jgi:hypothetical protein
MQFLCYDPHFDPTVPGAPPSPEFMAEMGRFLGEAMQAGVVVATGGLQPKGTHLTYSGGKFTVTDGPFIELKELLGGWAIINVASLDEAVEWCKRFRAIVGEGVTEIVPVMGPSGPMPG